MSENQQPSDGTTVVPANGNGHALAEVTPDDFLLRIARDTTIDADKMRVAAEIFIQTQEKQRQWIREDDAERARLAYYRDMALVQSEMPILPKDGWNPQTKSSFTELPTIMRLGAPIWTKFGFSTSFPVSNPAEGKIRIDIRVSHRDGHVELLPGPVVPIDTKGPQGTVNKTEGHGTASSMTYWRRQMLVQAFSLSAEQEDNDGNGSGNGDNSGRSQGTGVRQEVRRGPVEPPPKKPARQSPLELHRPLVISLVQKLRAIENDHEWSKAVQHACLAAPEREDLEEFAAYLEPSISHESMPNDIRTEIRVAIAAGRKRFANPPFDYPLLDPAGETDGEVFTDPKAWARAFMTLWDAASFPDQANLLHHNTDALVSARTDQMAAKMLAQAHPPPDDAGNGTGSPLSFYEAVRPPEGRGGPSWPAWVGLLRDELSTIPDLEADLLPWTEAQRPVLAEAPIVHRTEAVKLIIAAFGKAGRTPLPWFAQLLVPKDKNEADEAWLADRLAALEKLPTGAEGRKQFDGQVAAMRPEMKRLQIANPVVYAKLRAAFEAKHATLPQVAA